MISPPLLLRGREIHSHGETDFLAVIVVHERQGYIKEA